MTAAHTYPSNYTPGPEAGAALNKAWEILDSIAPGVIPLDARAFLAGQIAGALMQPTADATAVDHVIRAMQADGRKAWLMSWGSESWRLLTAAYGARHGMTQEQASEKLWATMKPTAVVVDQSEDD